jgi:hypothetical protein
MMTSDDDDDGDLLKPKYSNQKRRQARGQAPSKVELLSDFQFISTENIR